MEERLQAEWTTHQPDQAEKEQAISKLATQVEEQVWLDQKSIILLWLITYADDDVCLYSVSWGFKMLKWLKRKQRALRNGWPTN